MKSRARYHVYSTRAQASGNPALENVASMEADFHREAEKDWRAMIRQWALPLSKFERQALVAILLRAKQRAQRDVRVIFDDQTTTLALAEYFASFKPEDLIPPSGSS
jgi:hypothetical protein